MLIPSARHLPEDLEAWDRYLVMMKREAILRRRRLESLVARSAAVLQAFGSDAWVGVSWGKDSTVLLDLVLRFAPTLPVCWVVTVPGENPDCWPTMAAWSGRGIKVLEYEDQARVADDYLRIVDNEPWPPDADFGRRRIYGLRSDESSGRKQRSRAYGESTYFTCAPLTWWTGPDVLLYILLHDLPLHPAYAMTRGGAYDPARLRVAPIGGDQGVYAGRRRWERFYYADVLTSMGLT